MRLTLTIVGLLSLGLSACATVDFAEMAPQRDVAAAAPVQENVAIRAAETLYTSFTQKGWAAPAEANRVQKAANILLRGIGKAPKVIDNSYAGRAKSISQVRSDIALASGEVTRALKAADVFLSLAPEGDDLQDELAALEKALGACHKGELMFTRALAKVGAQDLKAEIAPLKTSIDRLKAVTNLYGDQVRSQTPIVGSAAS